MGQYCVKGFNSGGPNQLASKYGPLDQQFPSMNLDQLIMKESQVRLVSLHHRVTGLLGRLTYTELEILLGVFRNRVRYERELSPETADISLSDLASLLNMSLSKRGVEFSLRNRSIWKRLSLRSSTVVNLFASVSSESLAETRKELSRTFSLDLDGSMANDLLSAEQFFQIFLYTDYKAEERIRTPSLISKEIEIVLQDFAAVFAIILHGGTEDLLTLLFILFAEYPSSTAHQPVFETGKASSSGMLRSSLRLNRGKSADMDATLDTRIEAKERKRNISNASEVRLDQTSSLTADNESAAAGGGSSLVNNKRPSFFQSLTGSANSPSRKPANGSSSSSPINESNFGVSQDMSEDHVATKNALVFSNNNGAVELVASNNTHAAAENSPPPLLAQQEEAVSGGDALENSEQSNKINTLLYKKILTENNIKKLIIFVSIMVFKTAKDQRALQHSESLYKIKSALRLLTGNSNSNSSKTAAAAATGRATLPISYETYITFFKQLLTTTPEQSQKVQTEQNPLSKLAFLVSAKDLLRNVFRPLLFDLVQNPYKMMRQVVDLYESSSEIMQLQQALDGFQTASTSTASAKTSAVTGTAQGAAFDMFIIEARWWQIWCSIMELKPIYHGHDSINHVVIDLIPDTTANTAKVSATLTKYEQFNPFHAQQDQEDLESLPALENMFLVEEVLPGVMEFLDGQRLVPISQQSSAQAQGQAQGRAQGQQQAPPALRYVAVPAQVGELLFKYYDQASRDFHPNLFKRRLIVASNIISGDIIASPKIAMPTALNSFVHNFHAQRTVALDLHPFRLPFFWMTSLGLATINPLDVLSLPKHFDSVDDGTTLGMFTEQLVKRYAGLDVIAPAGQAASSAAYRLWALYDKHSINHHDARTLAESEAPIIIQFTAGYQWVLLTHSSTAWTRSCDGVLWAWNPIRSTALAESTPVIHGIMIESLTSTGTWPSDRIVQQAIITDNELRVGLSVDILTDYQVWKIGEISHILHYDEAETHLTIRSMDDANETVTVPVSSARVLRIGSMTNYDELSALPSLAMMPVLEDRAGRIIRSTAATGAGNSSSSSVKHAVERKATTAAGAGANSPYSPQLRPVPEQQNNDQQSPNPSEESSRNDGSVIIDDDTNNNNGEQLSNLIATKKNSVVPISIRFPSDKAANTSNTVLTTNASSIRLNSFEYEQVKQLQVQEESLRLFYTLKTSQSDFLGCVRLSQCIELARRIGELTTLVNQQLPPLLTVVDQVVDAGSIASTVASNSERMTGTSNNKQTAAGASTALGIAEQSQQSQQPKEQELSATTNNKKLTNGKAQPHQQQRNASLSPGLNLLHVVKGMVERVKRSSPVLSSSQEDNGSMKKKRPQPPPTGRQPRSSDQQHSPRTGGGGFEGTEELGEELVTREKFGIVGLNNLGNTCFLSAALQCLLRAPVFIPYFLSYQYQFDINTRSKFGTQGKLTEEFAQFVRLVYKPDLRMQLMINVNQTRRPPTTASNGGNNNRGARGTAAAAGNNSSSSGSFPAISPTTFLKLFQHHKTQFTGADQQDSQEFLSELLDTFHEDLKSAKTAEYTGHSSASKVVTRRSTMRMSIAEGTTGAAAGGGGEGEGEEPPLSGAQLMQDGNRAWEDYLKANDSIVSNVFQGQLCTHVTCEACRKSTTKFEAFTTLSLPIPRANGLSVASTGASMYAANEPVKVVIKLFYKMPRILTLLRLRTSQALTSKQWERVLEITKLRSKPLRLVLNSVPRIANIEQVKTALLQLLTEHSTAEDQPVLPALTSHTITVFDLHREEKYRIRKILESKEVLQSLVDDGSDDLELLVFENNKDISFISSLSGSRLSANTASRGGEKGEQQQLMLSDEELDTIIHGYHDEQEYENNNNSSSSKSRLLAASLVSSPGLLITDLDSQFIPPSSSSSSSSSSAGRTRVFPTKITDFQLYDRIDALDHKSQWYSGSIAEITTDNNNKAGEGVMVRIHFDSFSPIWDEYFTQAELTKGFIAPVYSHSQRKLKIYDCHVVHRRVVYSTTGEGLKVERIELLESPQVLQMESYRSIHHLHDHLIEQALRCAPESYYQSLSLNERKSCQPFQIRQLSVQNPYCAPAPNDDNTANSSSGSGSSDTVSVKSNKSANKKERFKLWEGRLFPSSTSAATTAAASTAAEAVLRPVVNIYHNKLLIAIDWEYITPAAGIRNGPLKPLSPLLHGNGGVVSGFVEVGQTCPMIRFRDHVSYAPPPPPSSTYGGGPPSLSVPQSAGDGNDSSNGKVISPTTTTSGGNKKEESNYKDNRPGLTIDHVLNRYMASESIDYFCEACKELKRGLLVSSIQRVPEVLVLHLKRLVMSSTGGAKIRTLVKFPLKGLDVTSCMTAQWGDAPPSPADPNAPPTAAAESTASADASTAAGPVASDPHCVYDLFGVVNHLGGMFGGHYTAYAKCEDLLLPDANNNHNHNLNSTQQQGLEVLLQEYLTYLPGGLGGLDSTSSAASSQGQGQTQGQQQRWFKFDDEFVLELPSQGYANGLPIDATIVSESAYLLFYRKRLPSAENMLRYL